MFKRVLKMSNLGTLLSHALKDVELTQVFVDDLTNTLEFSISEKIGFALALTDFERLDAKATGKADSSHVFLLISLRFIYLIMAFWYFLFVGRNLLLAEIEELCANTGQIYSTEQIQNVLLHLQKSEDLSRHLDSFIQILSSAQPIDEFSFALSPILSEVHEADVFRCCLRVAFIWPFLIHMFRL